MTNRPATVPTTRLLVLLNAVLWLLFGVITAAGVRPSFREPSLIRWAMAASASLAASILVAFAGLLKRRSRPPDHSPGRTPSKQDCRWFTENRHAESSTGSMGAGASNP